ncbi:MAG: TRAP transporter substrate-binding protein [Treponema sp.]|nr:TRAP transporter substrate-binding protein [Treponema sp.]
MLKKIIFFASLFTTLLSFSSCTKKTNSISDEKPITLVMAEVNPAETIAGQMDQAFKSRVEELSNGKIKIDLQCSGILGDVDSVMKLMLKPNSTIHIHRMSAVNMAMYGCSKSSLLSVPFTFSSKEHFWALANSELGKSILMEPLEKGLGLRGLFFGEEGFRHFFSTKRIEKVEDFNALNVRGTNDKAMQGMLQGLKANSVTVNYADLYAGLQTGLIDAAEQPIANYLANHFYQVAPYMIFDGHTLGIMETIITEECWQSLSEKNQNILLEAGKYASDFCRKLSQTEEDKVKETLKAEGAVLTPVKDLKPWQEACTQVIKDGSAINPELYQTILDFNKIDGAEN